MVENEVDQVRTPEGRAQASDQLCVETFPCLVPRKEKCDIGSGEVISYPSQDDVSFSMS